MTNATNKDFDSELENLQSHIIDMGVMIESQLINTIEAITHEDKYLAKTAMIHAIHRDSIELDLDEQCMQIIAQYQPVEKNLKAIMNMMKIISNLERIGELSSKIARTVDLLNHKNMSKYSEMNNMGNLVKNMIHQTLNCFNFQNNVDLANQIISQDDIVDKEYRKITQQIVAFMSENPRQITLSLEILFVAKSLERIADHAKHIACLLNSKNS